jgi:hypothetical protein
VFSFFFKLGTSYIRPVYYGLRPFAPFQYILLIQKKIPCNKIHQQNNNQNHSGKYKEFNQNSFLTLNINSNFRNLAITTETRDTAENTGNHHLYGYTTDHIQSVKTPKQSQNITQPATLHSPCQHQKPQPNPSLGQSTKHSSARNILQAIYNRDRGSLGRHHTQNTHWPEYTYPTSRDTADITIPQQSTQTHGQTGNWKPQKSSHTHTAVTNTAPNHQ